MNLKECLPGKQRPVALYRAAGLLLLALVMFCASAHARGKKPGGAAKQTCNVLRGLVDKRNKIEIKVLEKIGPSYKLAIGPYAG